jgi:hypothetical protein
VVRVAGSSAPAAIAARASPSASDFVGLVRAAAQIALPIAPGRKRMRGRVVRSSATTGEAQSSVFQRRSARRPARVAKHADTDHKRPKPPDDYAWHARSPLGAILARWRQRPLTWTRPEVRRIQTIIFLGPYFSTVAVSMGWQVMWNWPPALRSLAFEQVPNTEILTPACFTSTGQPL